jgi:hypothetical protein
MRVGCVHVIICYQGDHSGSKHWRNPMRRPWPFDAICRSSIDAGFTRLSLLVTMSAMHLHNAILTCGRWISNIMPEPSLNSKVIFLLALVVCSRLSPSLNMLTIMAENFLSMVFVFTAVAVLGGRIINVSRLTFTSHVQGLQMTSWCSGTWAFLWFMVGVSPFCLDCRGFNWCFWFYFPLPFQLIFCFVSSLLFLRTYFDSPLLFQLTYFDSPLIFGFPSAISTDVFPFTSTCVTVSRVLWTSPS